MILPIWKKDIFGMNIRIKMTVRPYIVKEIIISFIFLPSKNNCEKSPLFLAYLITLNCILKHNVLEKPVMSGFTHTLKHTRTQDFEVKCT